MLTVKRHGTDFPRRNCIDLLTPAEKAIYDAGQVVEAGCAHPLMTEAGQLLQQARDKVADFVELQLKQE